MIGSIDIKTRPIRLAYLVDPNSATQVREAIRLSSSLWGGPYFPIIPLHRSMPRTWRDKPLKTPLARHVTVGYIEGFDPDILVQFAKDVPSYVTNLGLEIANPETVWEYLRKKKETTPQLGVGIFELLHDVFDGHFKFKAKYPVKLVVPQVSGRLSLFWASVFGEFPADIHSVLREHYYEPLEIEDFAFEPKRLLDTMARNVLFPRRICQDNLVPHGRSRRDAFAFFLDAAKTEDVVDFWNLRAMGREVVPVPRQLKDHPQLRELLVGFLREHRRPWPHNPAVCDTATILRARSCSMDEVQAFARTLRIEHPPNDSSSDGFFSLQHWYPRIWDEWARDKDGGAIDVYGREEESVDAADLDERELRIKPVWPPFAERHAVHGGRRFANEIQFRLFGSTEPLAEAWPRTTGRNLTRIIGGKFSYRDAWRVGRSGLVKLVSWDIREAREVPSAEAVFFAWLADLGWKPTLSPPGILAKRIYRQLEGHPESYLVNEALLGLLEHMGGGRVKQDGSPAKQNEISQERFLSVAEVRGRLDSKGKDLSRRLVSMGLFALGLRVKCPQCLRHSWFALKEIGETLACPKCLNQFAAAGNLESGTWSYKTTGPFSVPDYAEGAYSVLLTQAFFNDRKLHSLRTTPVLSFSAEAAGKGRLEADLGLLWEESLFGEHKSGVLFAECKTYGVFGVADFERMRYLGRAFPGAILVFSTLRRNLTTAETREITRIAKAGRKYWKAERPVNPVMVLTGRELLDWQGPPDCWDGLPAAEQAKHIRGLLHVCDLTQQIHLGLPSWETAWHTAWEKKRQRRAPKTHQQLPNESGGARPAEAGPSRPGGKT